MKVILIRNPEDESFEICTFETRFGNPFFITNSLHFFESEKSAEDWCERMGYEIVERE